MIELEIPANLYWSYWATILYILGMIGYLTMDTLTYLFTSIDQQFESLVYTALALIFVIDAIFYNIDWYIYAVKCRDTNKPIPIEYRATLVACIFHHVGSQCYLIGSFLAFNKSRWIREFLLMNFFGILALILESTFTFLGWIIGLKRNSSTSIQQRCSGQNVYLWAHTLNILGSLIYLFATTLAYRFYVAYGIMNLNSIFILQMLGDLIYLFDAYLYYDCWKQDEKELQTNNERDKLIELRLAQQFFTLDEVDSDTKRNE